MSGPPTLDACVFPYRDMPLQGPCSGLLNQRDLLRPAWLRCYHYPPRRLRNAHPPRWVVYATPLLFSRWSLTYASAIPTYFHHAKPLMRMLNLIQTSFIPIYMPGRLINACPVRRLALSSPHATARKHMQLGPTSSRTVRNWLLSRAGC